MADFDFPPERMIPLEQRYPFTLPPLPYDYGALAPELMEKVLYFHHDKHFAAYVDALNQLLERAPAYQSWPLWKLCLNWEELPDDLRQGVRNSAGGVFNHDLYFRTLHPLPVSAPDTALEGAVVRDFGGMAGLKEAMRKADPVLMEPIMKVVVIVPEEYMGDVIGDLNSRRGMILGMDAIPGAQQVNAEVPLSEMFGYATDMRSKTQGRGQYTMEPAHYAEVPKNISEKIISERGKKSE